MTEIPKEVVPVRDAMRTLFDNVPEESTPFKDFRQLMVMLVIAKELGREIDRILPDFMEGPLKEVAEQVSEKLYRIVDEQIKAMDLPGLLGELEMIERRFMQ